MMWMTGTPALRIWLRGSVTGMLAAHWLIGTVPAKAPPATATTYPSNSGPPPAFRASGAIPLM